MSEPRFDWSGSQPGRLNRRDKIQFAVVMLLLLSLLGTLAVGETRIAGPSSGTTEQRS